ncbi:MAG: DUF1080 domain-containing protein [Proteobacteria bacterium]|nr:DUF1080 domain-containing protein [Pseudomonadota bacterium]
MQRDIHDFTIETLLTFVLCSSCISKDIGQNPSRPFDTRVESNYSSSFGRKIDLMDRRLWEPAKDAISDVFWGLDNTWQSQDLVWRIPDLKAKRPLVTYRRENVINHMYYSAKTKDDFGSLRLSFEFKIDGSVGESFRPDWLGNSGVFLMGMYEIQILDSSRILKTKFLSQADPATSSGFVKIPYSGNDMNFRLNELICGSIYKIKTVSDPLFGVPFSDDGKIMNSCFEPETWIKVELRFDPPAFVGGKKIANARISEYRINNSSVFFRSENQLVSHFELPGPTGSLHGRSETSKGPIVIQDHGSPVSFRNFKIETH